MGEIISQYGFRYNLVILELDGAFIIKVLNQLDRKYQIYTHSSKYIRKPLSKLMKFSRILLPLNKNLVAMEIIDICYYRLLINFIYKQK